ncbi:flagellar assembly peptidoglycan hydrolase FlgJ [Vibrio mangrovi]|uniref:Peptidoglycan hydrolase FlgJ n=1 Tax=Vibrio mangrovi TaxID=474394 RepID=A0A1Y6IV91_9VIBR|nr:flagellar assembly peptidoglycan hydrolase FlgJ [Vibrio mangrovi]MDW6001563.1 flagellar assembly peptidoglycan hydrolase FlgJ [Vibrio mangrovi]SMS00412.1 Peptidoglycan hydrolase FlgJ [Vibrio mangrovi]
MINDAKDIGFVQDITQLDKLRQKAVSGDTESEKSALTAAAKQFEAVFTSMLFKSMRKANSGFESDLFHSKTEDFYRQMLDEQMASHLSTSGRLGLADMIVAQLSTNIAGDKPKETSEPDQLQQALARIREHQQQNSDAEKIKGTADSASVPEPRRFDSPESFIHSLRPYAEKAARVLGVDASVLLAQAALETGWGTKVVANSRGSSHNLFNIKADRSWQGDKMATQTLEYYGHTPVVEKASFRAYDSYQDSFNDYVNFLSGNPRYMAALSHQGDATSFIQGIHQAGYATDPEYAEKVLRVRSQIQQMD